MFETLKCWYRNRQQQQPSRPRARIILSVEWLEKRQLLSGDQYLWNPGNVNKLASNPANWEKFVNGNWVQQGANGTLPGQGGQSPYDIVDLYGDHSQSDITWDKSFTFSKLVSGFGYTGTEYIENLSTTLDVTGKADGTAVGADGFGGNPGLLNVEFEYTSDILQIDGNSNIAVFSFKPEGSSRGTVLIDGGTTNICTGTLSQNSVLNGTIKIQGLAAIEDKG